MIMVMTKLVDWLIKCRLWLACKLAGKHTLAINLRIEKGTIVIYKGEHIMMRGLYVTDAPDAVVSYRGWAEPLSHGKAALDEKEG